MSVIHLTTKSWVRRLLVSRWPQLILQLIALAGFGVVLIAGWVGTPVGNHNFGIIAVWIAWWALLILLLVPGLGRAWCSVCPLPLAGEWLDRRSLLGPLLDRSGQPRPGLGLGRRWPARLRNIWLQNGSFLLLALFSAVVLTQPTATALVLTAIIVVAMGVGMIFERRAFCRYLCPVGGFIGLYANAAPVELRISDPTVCRDHTVKTCYQGNENGYGCPWGVFTPTLTDNTACGFCLECLRTCPHNNVTLRLRAPGGDLHWRSGRKLDGAYKSFIMLGCALVYSAVMLGPWGSLKQAAYDVGSGAWIAYTMGMLGFVLLLLPGVFLLAAAIGRHFARVDHALKPTTIGFAYGLIPLGLTAWMAFSVSFVFANISYLWPVLSDPMGWGWNLLGTAALSWQPYLSGLAAPLQILLLLIGLGWTSSLFRSAADELGGGLRLAAPSIAAAWLVTLALLWLLVG